MQVLQHLNAGLASRIINASNTSLAQWLSQLPVELHSFVLKGHFPTLSTTQTLSLTDSNHRPEIVAKVLEFATTAAATRKEGLQSIELSAVALDGDMDRTGITPPLPGLYPGHEFGTLQPPVLPALSLLLQVTPSVKALTISQSIMAPAGAFGLAQLLENLHLEKFYLTKCQIGSQALHHLMTALATTAQQPALTSLSLAGNTIYAACVDPLSRALTKIPLLLELDMAGCRVLGEGNLVAAIVSSLPSLSQITHLDFQNAAADRHVMKQIAVSFELLSQCHKLAKFAGNVTQQVTTEAMSKGQEYTWPELKSLTVASRGEVILSSDSEKSVSTCTLATGAQALQELRASEDDQAAFGYLKAHLNVAMMHLTVLDVDLMGFQWQFEENVVSVIAQLSQLTEIKFQCCCTVPLPQSS